jgi:hypothetical protein
MEKAQASALFLLIILLSISVAGNTGYSLSGEPAIDTPTRNISFEGQDYTINAVSRITANGSVTIRATAPANKSYLVALRGPENQIISTDRQTGGGTHTFEYFGSPPKAGTYVATLEQGGTIVAVYPIIISGYRISISQTDGNTVMATISERDVQAHSSAETVQLVLASEDSTHQQRMTQVTGTKYRTTITGLAPGTYSGYVLVRGNKTVRRQSEILSISDTINVRVQDSMANVTTSEQTATRNENQATAERRSEPTANILTPSTETTDGSGTGFTAATTLVALLLGIFILRAR